MKTDRKVSITISVSKTYRDQLRTMAARRNFHDPDQLTSASTIAREIICENIDELERIETNFVGLTGMNPDNSERAKELSEKDEL